MTTSLFAKSATQSSIITNSVESLIISDVGDLSAIKSLNSGSLGQFRNKLIGGDFGRNPWQRGTTFIVTTTGTYVADRWRVDFDGTANITVSKVALPTAQMINGIWCAYGLKFLVNSTASNTFMRLSQRIEDVDTLTTLPATLQTAIIGSRGFVVPVNARQSFGTGGSPSADVVTAFSTSLSVTSSMQFLSTGLTVPTISGKTLGTGLNDFLATEYDLTNIPVGDYVIIALSGLEAGNYATVWEDRRRIELSLCQRYYQRIAFPFLYSLPCSGRNDNVVFRLPTVGTFRVGNPTTTHNVVDNQFVSTTPISEQWAVVLPGIFYLTKTGTTLFDVNSNNYFVCYGMTFSSAPTVIQFGPSVYFQLSAEL